MEPVVFGALVFLGILLVFASMLVGQQLDPVQARLQQISVRPRTLEELELQRPIAERTLKPIVQGLAAIISRFYPANTARSLQNPPTGAPRRPRGVDYSLGLNAS